MNRKYIAELIRKIDNCETEYLKQIDDSLFRIASNAELFWDDQTPTECLNEYGKLTYSQRKQVLQFIERF